MYVPLTLFQKILVSKKIIMNKENLIKEYFWLKVEYKPIQEWKLHSRYINRTKTIYIYDLFFEKTELEQYGLLEHEVWHYLYNKFSPTDKSFRETISKWDNLMINLLNLAFNTWYICNWYVSKYAETNTQEDFCELLKYNYMLKKKWIEHKYNTYIDNKMIIALNLKNKYE